MNKKREHSDSLRAGREMLVALIARTEQWIARLPEVKRLRDLQRRAEQRISHLDRTRPNFEQSLRRTRAVHEGRCGRVTLTWNQMLEFMREAQHKFDELSAILGDDEVERRKTIVDWYDLFSILKGLKSAEQALGEYWQCRPGQSGTQRTAARTTSLRRRSSKLASDPLAEVRDIGKRMRAQGCSHLEICDALADLPRPETAKWKHLSWPAAIRNAKYREAVRTKISKLARE